jgi:hypothetical protein
VAGAAGRGWWDICLNLISSGHLQEPRDYHLIFWAAVKAGEVEVVRTLLNYPVPQATTAAAPSSTYNTPSDPRALPAAASSTNPSSQQQKKLQGSRRLHFRSTQGGTGAALHLDKRQQDRVWVIDTALQEAASCGHVPLLQYLLAVRASLDQPPAVQLKLPHLAARKGHIPVLDLLLTDFVKWQEKWHEALDAATFAGQAEVCHWLVSHSIAQHTAPPWMFAQGAGRALGDWRLGICAIILGHVPGDVSVKEQEVRRVLEAYTQDWHPPRITVQMLAHELATQVRRQGGHPDVCSILEHLAS